MHLLLRQPDVVNNDTRKHRQANRRNHPGASQILVHIRRVKANDRHKRQTETKSTRNRQPNNRTRAALRLSERQAADERVQDQCDTTLVPLASAPAVLEKEQ